LRLGDGDSILVVASSPYERMTYDIDGLMLPRRIEVGARLNNETIRSKLDRDV
jgi:hypothetical protein